MINKYFENKFPFAYSYFSKLLVTVKNNEKKFPQAIIFEGEDTINQYLFSLELARNLNCENYTDENCECINCKWIKSFSHPSVNNVSQIHFKSDNDETKTVISTKQAKEIEQSLTLSSDYHRFFIFFSSDKKEYTSNELECFNILNYNNDIDYSIKPLDFKTFHPATPNALLKSIEEPPQRTTFIFLTKSKENILSTIVSRCFPFKLSSPPIKKGYSDITNIIKDYPDLDYKKAIFIADELINLSKGELGADDILNEIIEYLKDLMLRNISNDLFVNKIQNDIKIVNDAIKQAKANISDKLIFEGLMLRLSRGY